MNDEQLWNLFQETGDPLSYLLYRAGQDRPASQTFHRVGSDPLIAPPFWTPHRTGRDAMLAPQAPAPRGEL